MNCAYPFHEQGGFNTLDPLSVALPCETEATRSTNELPLCRLVGLPAEEVCAEHFALLEQLHQQQYSESQSHGEL